MKLKKTLLGLGTVATVAGPMAATISCGSDDDYSLKDTIVVYAAEDTTNSKATPRGYIDYMNKAIELFKEHFPAEAAKYKIKVLNKDDTFGVDWKTLGIDDKTLPDFSFAGTETVRTLIQDNVFTHFDPEFLDSLEAKGTSSKPSANFSKPTEELLEHNKVQMARGDKGVILPYKQNLAVNFINGDLFFKLLMQDATVTTVPNKSQDGATDLSPGDLNKIVASLAKITRTDSTVGTPELQHVAKKIWAIFGKGHDQNYSNGDFSFLQNTSATGAITHNSALMTDLINLDVHKMIVAETTAGSKLVSPSDGSENQAFFLTQTPNEYGMIPWVGSYFKGQNAPQNHVEAAPTAGAATLYQDSYGEFVTGDASAFWSFHAYNYTTADGHKKVKNALSPIKGHTDSEMTPWTHPMEDAGRLVKEFIGNREMLNQDKYDNMYKQDEKFKTGNIAMYQSGGWNDGGFNEAAKANGFNLFSVPLGYYEDKRTNLDGGVIGTYLAKRLEKDKPKKHAVEHFIQCLMQKAPLDVYTEKWEGLSPAANISPNTMTMSARSMSFANATLFKNDSTSMNDKDSSAWDAMKAAASQFVTTPTYAKANADNFGTIFGAAMDTWADSKTWTA